MRRSKRRRAAKAKASEANLFGERIVLFARGDNFWYICKTCLAVWTVSLAVTDLKCKDCEFNRINRVESLESRRKANERRLERMKIEPERL